MPTRRPSKRDAFTFGASEFRPAHQQYRALEEWQREQEWFDVGEPVAFDRFTLESWIEHPDGPPKLLVDAVYLNCGGAPALYALTVRAGLPLYPELLTHQHIRSVRLGDLADEARRRIGEKLASSPASWGRLRRDETVPDNWIRDFRRQHRPGRQGRADLFYAQLAADYVRSSQTTRTPVKDLAAVRHISASQLRNLLHEARRRELLTASSRGKSGGQLTDKARRLLDGTR